MSLPQYRIYSLNLVPGIPQDVSLTGNFISCLTSSERFLVSLNGQSPIPLAQGLSLLNIPEVVTRIQVTALSGALFNPNFIELAVGFGEFRDGRLSTTAPIVFAPGQFVTQKSAASLSCPNVDLALAAAANTLIGAANVNRRAIRVRNLSTVDAVRLSSFPADLTAGRGYTLGAGEDAEFNITAELYARSAGTPTINTSEEIY